METTRVLSTFIMAVMVLSQQLLFAGSVGVGINYGFNGDNLPPPNVVIDFLKSKGIERIRIFEPRIDVLEALRGSNIAVILGIRNEDLVNLANNPDAATTWINQYIIPYYQDVEIVWLTAGNEVIPGENAVNVVPAMRNLIASLKTNNLENIVVTTVVSSSVLAASYPPSQAVFNDQNMIDVVNFLHSESNPLMVNIYPYFALASDPDHIELDFALFNRKDPAFTDEGRPYFNLFDAMYDSFLAAIEKTVGDLNIQVIVSESGWPSAGAEPFATIDNAMTYNNNLKNHAPQGSPRYNTPIDIFFFALFNENLKEQGVEQNFGNFYPSLEAVYPLW